MSQSLTLLGNYLFGQSLPKGLNYTEHSYLQMIKQLITTNFSKMSDVLEGRWSELRKKSETLRTLSPGPPLLSRSCLCYLSPRVGFIFPFCTISYYLREGAMLTSSGTMKSENGSSSTRSKKKNLKKGLLISSVSVVPILGLVSAAIGMGYSGPGWVRCPAMDHHSDP